ncbi:hypothetical protein ZWY2020_009687, partial [Hordeum vulgare]
MRRHMNLISKVFSADKMNHAQTHGGPRGLHTWRSGKGLGCYQELAYTRHKLHQSRPATNRHRREARRGGQRGGPPP